MARRARISQQVTGPARCGLGGELFPEAAERTIRSVDFETPPPDKVKASPAQAWRAGFS